MNKIIKTLGAGLVAGVMMVGGVVMPMTSVWADGGTIEERLASLESDVNGLKYDVAYISQKNIVPMRSEQEALWRYYNTMESTVRSLGFQIDDIYDLIAGLPQGVDEETMAIIMDLNDRLMMVEQEFVNLNSGVVDLASRMETGENSLSGLSVLLDRINGELMEVKRTMDGGSEANNLRVVALESRVSELKGQLATTKEEGVGLRAQVASLLTWVEALSKKIQESEAKVAVTSGGAGRDGVSLGTGVLGVGGMGMGVLGANGFGVYSSSLGGGVNNSPDNSINMDNNKSKEDQKGGKEGSEESQGGNTQKTINERTTEVVEVPETGGEEQGGGNGWWLIIAIVLLGLGLGVLAWWGIPRILERRRG